MQSGEEARTGGRDVAKQRYREMLGNSKDYETLCLNQSELKHMHAIRPYCSKEQQRKSTRRQHQSPFQMSRSHSKRLDSSSRKSQQKSKRGTQGPSSGKQMNEMLSELINLKSEYKVLKANYSKVFTEKKEEALRQQALRKNLQDELEKKGKEMERAQKSASLLEQQIDRIRKECSRVLQLERFKIKKLQETLQEKELMIAYLRNELDCIKRNNNTNDSPPTSNPSLFFLQNSTPMLNFSYLPKPNISLLSAIPEPARPSFPAQEDSLCLSRDKSKENDSIFQSFLSNDHSIHPNFYKKEALIHSLEESPIVPEIEPIEEMSQPSQKEVMDLKKSKVISQLAIQSKGKVKPHHKRLQILIADENSDTQNIPSNSLRDEISLDTRKKLTNNSSLLCKQKKKLTAKKVRPF